MTTCPNPAPPVVVAPAEALPPCENIPARVGKLGALGGVPDLVAHTLILPDSRVNAIVLNVAGHIDRENALEKCALSRGLLTPETVAAPATIAPVP